MPRRTNLATLIGSIGMVAFLGSLLVFGDSDDMPEWLFWPSATATLVLIPLGWYLDWRAGRRGDDA